jgi:hypothetical protein
MTSVRLQKLYHALNGEFFDSILPPCEIVWSRQLTRAAGNIDVRARRIKLSTPILRDAFIPPQLFAPSFCVCGIHCDNCDDAIREILKHEMIHLWLFEKKLPHGHTREFREKARALGQSKIRHEIAVPPRTSGWEYSCAHCGGRFSRRRRYGRAVACAMCCNKFGNGKFDVRFKLKGKRIVGARHDSPKT